MIIPDPMGATGSTIRRAAAPSLPARRSSGCDQSALLLEDALPSRRGLDPDTTRAASIGGCPLSRARTPARAGMRSGWSYEQVKRTSSRAPGASVIGGRARLELVEAPRRGSAAATLPRPPLSPGRRSKERAPAERARLERVEHAKCPDRPAATPSGAIPWQRRRALRWRRRMVARMGLHGLCPPSSNAVQVHRLRGRVPRRLLHRGRLARDQPRRVHRLRCLRDQSRSRPRPSSRRPRWPRSGPSTSTSTRSSPASRARRSRLAVYMLPMTLQTTCGSSARCSPRALVTIFLCRGGPGHRRALTTERSLTRAPRSAAELCGATREMRRRVERRSGDGRGGGAAARSSNSCSSHASARDCAGAGREVGCALPGPAAHWIVRRRRRRSPVVSVGRPSSRPRGRALRQADDLERQLAARAEAERPGASTGAGDGRRAFTTSRTKRRRSPDKGDAFYARGPPVRRRRMLRAEAPSSQLRSAGVAARCARCRCDLLGPSGFTSGSTGKPKHPCTCTAATRWGCEPREGDRPPAAFYGGVLLVLGNPGWGSPELQLRVADRRVPSVFSAARRGPRADRNARTRRVSVFKAAAR